MSITLHCDAHGCPYAVEYDGYNYEAARKKIKAHRRRTHETPREPITDGGMIQTPPTIEWPLQINDHTVEKTHAPGLTSQHVACTGCSATAVYSVHDIGTTSQLDDLVTLLIDRLPDRCQPATASREVAIDE